MTKGSTAVAGGGARRRDPLRMGLVLLAKAVAIYVVLMLLWRPVAPGVAWGFRGMCDVAAAGVYRGAIQIRYVPGAIGQRDADTIVHYQDVKRRVGSAAGINMSSWYYAYVPLSMIVALTLATPIAWSRRIRALALGLLVMGVVVVLGQMLMVYDELVRASVLKLGVPWRGTVHTSATVVRELPGSFFIPIVVYALVALGDGALREMLGVAGDPPAGAGGALGSVRTGEGRPGRGSP